MTGAPRRRPGLVARAALRLVPAAWRESVARDLADEAVRDGRRGWRGDIWLAWHALRVAARFRSNARMHPPATITLAPNLGTDVRLAWRAIRREPASALAVVLTLALGTGAVTATYAVVNYALLRPVPGVVDEARLISVYSQVDASTPMRTSITFAHLEAMRSQSPALTDLAAWNWTDRALTIDPGDPPRTAKFVEVSRGFFEILGVRPRLGRLYMMDEYESTGTNVLVISERLWRRAFNGDPAIVGRRVNLNGHPFEIVGVAREYRGLDRLRHEDGWLTEASGQTFDSSESRGPTRWASTNMIGRLAPGATLEAAQAQLIAAFRAVGERRIDTKTYWPIAFEGVTDGIGLTRSRIAALLRVMLAGVGLLLLLACANAANLMLARHLRRRSNLSVRHALGAGRWRLLRELLVEASALAFGAGVLGLGLAMALTSIFRSSRLLSYLPVLDELGLDWRVAAFCASVSAATVFIFGLVPAWMAARADMRLGAPANRATGRAGLLRTSLVGAQVALSFALVVAAALLAQTVHRLQAVDFGFRADRVLHFTFAPSRAGYDDAATSAAMAGLRERLAATPGVSRSALAFFPPVGGSTAGSVVRVPSANHTDGLKIRSHSVTEEYFDVLGIPVLHGRTFTSAEAASPPVDAGPVVLNEPLARRLFGAAPATGQTILQQTRSTWQPRTVIGVVGATLGNDVREGYVPMAYEPFGRRRIAAVLVRPDAEFLQAAAAIRRIAREVAPAVAVDEIESLRVAADELIAQERVISRLSLVIGAIAGLLALAGLYAAMAQFTGERMREFAIRTAIGATRGQVAAGLFGRVGRIAVAGLIIGGALIWPLTGLLAAYLFGVSRNDALTLAGAAVALSLAALAAAWPAVRRAARVDPATVLRGD